MIALRAGNAPRPGPNGPASGVPRGRGDQAPGPVPGPPQARATSPKQGRHYKNDRSRRKRPTIPKPSRITPPTASAAASHSFFRYRPAQPNSPANVITQEIVPTKTPAQTTGRAGRPPAGLPVE